MKTKFFIPILIIFGLLLPLALLMASNIADDAPPAYNKWSWGENIGWMNWKPSFGGTDYGVTVYDDRLEGYIWAENVGWINLSPVTYDGVTNDGLGNLSGYAWGENVGWISFSSDYHQVVINGEGEFTGYAWGENIGWISLNCSNTASCGTVDFKVKTTWSPAVEPTVTTQDATDVGIDSATLNMSFAVGDYSSVEVRFSWRATGTVDWATTTWTPKETDGTHFEGLTGLDSDTEYEFKAQLKYNTTEIEGSVLSFTTLAVEEEPPAVPLPRPPAGTAQSQVQHLIATGNYEYALQIMKELPHLFSEAEFAALEKKIIEKRLLTEMIEILKKLIDLYTQLIQMLRG